MPSGTPALALTLPDWCCPVAAPAQPGWCRGFSRQAGGWVGCSWVGGGWLAPRPCGLNSGRKTSWDLHQRDLEANSRSHAILVHSFWLWQTCYPQKQQALTCQRVTPQVEKHCFSILQRKSACRSTGQNSSISSSWRQPSCPFPLQTG